MKKALRIIGIVIAAIILIVAVAVAVFAYNNTHWYDENERNIKKVGAVEKQAALPNGRVINYGEVENDKPALMLIHGQMGAWEDYANLLPELSKNWHVYAVDVYGHGESSHDESLYYLDVNGDDLIWFIEHVIGVKTVVSGHSNGALTTAYIAAYGKEWVAGALLEDPPVFSTEGENWENNFAYLDTYKVVHDYNQTDKSESWAAYYLRHCYWGQLFMKDGMDGIANYAQQYSAAHPGEEVKIFFLPSSITGVFHYVDKYDFKYGEHFYDLSWNNGHSHKEILSGVEAPCIYLHAKEGVAENGVYLCAASREQAERAVGYIGENCKLIETSTSDHTIHTVHSDVYLNAINQLLPQ
ncbi:MAG: alpha/beta hydrolase [Eubacteriales bacterium]|nr:alpha/beta hydrolase [Eubacteriales bacterium]